MKSFKEAENYCRASFEMCGEAYHAYTSGKDMPLLFENDENLAFVMNVVALAAYMHKDTVKILAFEVMNNHFHFVIRATKEAIDIFFGYISKKLKRTIPLCAGLKLSLKPINDLVVMRNNIVYVNRNGYVSNPAYTPFSYPWGTGRYYFNDFPTSLTVGDLGYEEKRLMFRGRYADFPEDWNVVYPGASLSGQGPYKVTGNTGYICPSSYCAIKLGMSMFRDAHHYFAAISKNVEAYSGIAVELDDGEFLTDQELFSQILRIVREKYLLASAKELTGAQRLELARSLHYDYRSSNGQIRRVLGLTQYEVDSLFPMGKG